MMIPTLETPRLRLRSFHAADVDAYSSLCADPNVVRFLGDGIPMTRADCWRQVAIFLGHWELRGYGMWALESRATGEFLGRVGFHNPEGWPDFEIGWALGSAYWGQGYATEAAHAALRVAFSDLERPHVISLIHPDNKASIAVAERLGQTEVGRTTIASRPSAIYRLERSAYRAA